MPYAGPLLAAGICLIGIGPVVLPIAALALAIDYGRRAFLSLLSGGRGWQSWRWIPTPFLAALCVICAWTDWPLRYRFAGVQEALEREALRLLATPAPPTSGPAAYDPVFDGMEYKPINEPYEGRFGTFFVDGVGVFREQRVVYFFTDSWIWSGWGFVYHADNARVPWATIPLTPNWSSFAYVPMK